MRCRKAVRGREFAIAPVAPGIWRQREVEVRQWRGGTMELVYTFEYLGVLGNTARDYFDMR